MSTPSPQCPATPEPRPQTDWLLLVGLLTWALVASIELMWRGSTLLATQPAQLLLTVLGYLVALLGFLLVALASPSRWAPGLPKLGVALQVMAVLGLQLLDHRSLNQILLVMWASQLPYFLSLGRSVLLCAAAIVLNAMIQAAIEPTAVPWFEPTIYFTFCLFAMFTSRNAMVTEQARLELAQRNAELEATQKLLAASAQHSERLRIARDLHDTMGHHLTALALQLEILQHQTGTAAEQTQAQARQLVKLLLADVRATVSNLRSEHQLDVQPLLAPLLRSSPKLKIIADIAPDLKVADTRIAETLLRAVQEILTNTWRHSSAQQLTLRLHQQQESVVLTAEDDGQVANDWQPGNGLKGLSERVNALSGHYQFGPNVHGHFSLRISLPQVTT
ncbi:MAG TPA: histidine kinase [Permianibacter sp.]|nr:histidine kinase [Permianibacter sp.]